MLLSVPYIQIPTLRPMKKNKFRATTKKSFKKMFWKKAEGGVVAYLSSDGAAVVWQDGEEEQHVARV
jgi:hypothetical protein